MLYYSKLVSGMSIQYDDTATDKAYFKDFIFRYLENRISKDNASFSSFITSKVTNAELLELTDNEDIYITDCKRSDTEQSIVVRIYYKGKKQVGENFEDMYKCIDVILILLEKITVLALPYKAETLGEYAPAAFDSCPDFYKKLKIKIAPVEVYFQDLTLTGWVADSGNVYKFVSDYKKDNGGIGQAVALNWWGKLNDSTGYAVLHYEPGKCQTSYFDPQGHYLTTVSINDSSIVWTTEECKNHTKVIFPNDGYSDDVTARILGEYFGDGATYEVVKLKPSNVNDPVESEMVALTDKIKPLDTEMIKKRAVHNGVTEDYNNDIRYLLDFVNRLNKANSVKSSVLVER